MGICNCSMFCCMLLYVLSSIAIILMGKRELIALLNLSSWCLVMVERLFLTVPRGCLQFVIVVFPDHTHLLFLLSGVGILTRDEACSPWLNSDLEDKLFLSYMDILMMYCFLPFFQEFLSEHIMSKKRGHLELILIGFSLFPS